MRPSSSSAAIAIARISFSVRSLNFFSIGALPSHFCEEAESHKRSREVTLRGFLAQHFLAVRPLCQVVPRRAEAGQSNCISSLQLHVLGLGCGEDGDVVVGVLPGREKVLIRGACFGGFPHPDLPFLVLTYYYFASQRRTSFRVRFRHRFMCRRG